MTAKHLSIRGYRGFSKTQKLYFSQPNGQLGSGLTVLVGPNSGGKSTVVESLYALSSRTATFSEGKRNKSAGNRVSFVLQMDSTTHKLQTVDGGGSETKRTPEGSHINIYVLPSRRFFNPYFSKSSSDRNQYLQITPIPQTRSSEVREFYRRLFRALERKHQFNEFLGKIVNPLPEWTIDQSDQGGHYVSVDAGRYSHNSDGLGEGIVSILFLVDALYDSSPGDLIVIDEPELSLHPKYQKRILRLFGDLAKNRQIVYATHSPYMLNLDYVLNGAQVARVYKNGASSRISQPKTATIARLRGLIEDLNNPHALGLDARETFFQDDGVIVLEGQEDVVHYQFVLEQLVEENVLSIEDASALEDCFFGWGAGGASKIEVILSLLKDLGFTRVAAVFDKNEAGKMADVRKKFPEFCVEAIPADDVRTKPERTGRSEVIGLLDRDNCIRPQFADETKTLFSKVKQCVL